MRPFTGAKLIQAWFLWREASLACLIDREKLRSSSQASPCTFQRNLFLRTKQKEITSTSFVHKSKFSKQMPARVTVVLKKLLDIKETFSEITPTVNSGLDLALMMSLLGHCICSPCVWGCNTKFGCRSRNKLGIFKIMLKLRNSTSEFKLRSTLLRRQPIHSLF